MALNISEKKFKQDIAKIITDVARYTKSKSKVKSIQVHTLANNGKVYPDETIVMFDYDIGSNDNGFLGALYLAFIEVAMDEEDVHPLVLSEDYWRRSHHSWEKKINSIFPSMRLKRLKGQTYQVTFILEMH